MPTVALAILNYDGKSHLAELIPSAIEAVSAWKQNCPIIVLDNRSPGEDVSWLRTNYPQVEAVVSPKNDYLFSYNWLLAQREEDVIILLNNDLKLSSNFISCLVRHFEDPDVFAASSKAYSWEGDYVNSGPCNFHIRHRGWVIAEYQSDQQVLSHTLFCSGGFMAVDRRKFIDLGGFDELYRPAYGEDKDLGFRAWSKGWKSIYEPGCHVFHREGGSWDLQTNRSKRLIAVTNYLFMWRNLRSFRFQFAHHLYLIWLTIRKRIERDTPWLETLQEARKLWQERRHKALEVAPCAIDLRSLQRICGRAVVADSE